MAEKIYSSIIDSFLDSRDPDYKALGLAEAKSSGDDWLDRTHDYANTDFLDEIAEGVSKHTAVPPTSKGATLTNRLLEKENAAPRMGSGRTAQARTAGGGEDDASLFAEVTESFEEAFRSGKVEKKHRSDAEIQSYVKQLLNQGTSPSKVATQLKKLAEIERFDHKAASSYLTQMAGLLGTAYLIPNKAATELELFDKSKNMGNSYINNSNAGGTGIDVLEPNTFMDGHKEASSNDCVRQAKAWKAAGITPRAKSIKQVTACADCSYFKTATGSKTCSLYGLPVVGNAKELASVVNKLTAGVPKDQKRAALVQIANRQPERTSGVQNTVTKTPQVHVSSFTKEREFGFAEGQHFSGSLIQKAHAAGHSLKAICAASDKKYGPLETSKAVREFIASLRKEKGKIIVAQEDANYLKKIGMHNEAIVGASKCASCSAHTSKENRKSASTEMVTRAPETFVQATLSTVRSGQSHVVANFDSAAVTKLHKAGHSIEKIFKAASAKYGSAQTSKAIRDWALGLRASKAKIALSQIDCTTLKKMGVKLAASNAIIGEAKCSSCTYRNGMQCGLTGGTLLSFPGMNQVASKKKVAANAPVDGRAILSEFDLMGSVSQDDITMRVDRPDDVTFGSEKKAHVKTAGTIGPHLTPEQVSYFKEKLVPKGTPVRFLYEGQALNVITGQLTSKGSNVIYHPVYWNFDKATAIEIAKALDAIPSVKPVFSEE